MIIVFHYMPDVNPREFRDPSIASMVVGLMQIFYSRSPYFCFSITPFNNLVYISLRVSMNWD